MSDRKFKIATLNTISLSSRKRKEWLFSLLVEERIDIIFLQETKIASPEAAAAFSRFLGNYFYCFFTVTRSPRGGTAILIRKNRGVSIIDCELSKDGRFTMVDCMIGLRLSRLISIYAPNEQLDRKLFRNPETLPGVIGGCH